MAKPCHSERPCFFLGATSPRPPQLLLERRYVRPWPSCDLLIGTPRLDAPSYPAGRSDNGYRRPQVLGRLVRDRRPQDGDDSTARSARGERVSFRSGGWPPARWGSGRTQRSHAGTGRRPRAAAWARSARASRGLRPRSARTHAAAPRFRARSAREPRTATGTGGCDERQSVRSHGTRPATTPGAARRNAAVPTAALSLPTA